MDYIGDYTKVLAGRGDYTKDRLCYYCNMVDLVEEMLSIQAQVNKVIGLLQTEHRAATTHPDPDIAATIATAAAALPNPAPAAAFEAEVTKLRAARGRHYISGKRLAPLLRALGYRPQRQSAGIFYWRPNDPAPSTPWLHDPEPQQDRSPPAAPTPTP